jgi:hypothetical protein
MLLLWQVLKVSLVQVLEAVAAAGVGAKGLANSIEATRGCRLCAGRLVGLCKGLFGAVDARVRNECCEDLTSRGLGRRLGGGCRLLLQRLLL